MQANLVLQDLKVIKDRQVRQAILDPKDKTVLKEQQVSRVRQVREVIQGHPETLVQLVLLVKGAIKAPQDLRVLLELEAMLGLQVLQEVQGLLVKWAHQVRKVQKVDQGILDLKEKKDPLEVLVAMAIRVLLDFKVMLVPLVPQDLPAMLDNQVSLVTKVQPDLLVLLDHQEHLEIKDHPEIKVVPVKWDLLDLVVRLVLREPLEAQDSLDHQDRRETLASKDRLAYRVCRVFLEILEVLALKVPKVR